MPSYGHLYQRKIRLFQELYRFTYSQCGECANTDCACKDSICQHVEEQALKHGVRLERTSHRLRFIGCHGCVVPPHLRETCTIYVCEKAQKKPSFDHQRYKKLKRLCDKVEWRLMELEEAGAHRF